MPDINKLFLETISSTNTYAKENAGKLTLPSLIVANKQTAGRGRRGNSFYSPPKTGLYMTVLFPAPNDCNLLTPAAAIAVCQELEPLGIQPKIKWVNDIFFEGKKVCGILTELFSQGEKHFIALGIGINMTTDIFPDNLPHAGSININCDKTALAERIAERILKYAESPDNKAILSEYEKRLFVIGQSITFIKNNKEYSAKAVGINKQCNLIVRLSDGSEEILSSGEISIKI